MATKPNSRRSLKFVLTLGVFSFFADFTYEGSRSILGPYLALLGASGFAVGAVTGFGELAGYALRLVSGRVADKTQAFWPITIFGYVIQMAAVPALALAQSWPQAAVLIILERVGKAIRNPPRDAMLAHAGQQMSGYGWAFGIHEALDQWGALLGPLAVATVLSWKGNYRLAFASLLVPAVINLALVVTARLLYPRPQDLSAKAANVVTKDLPRRFWIYLAGAALVAAGFADYPLIAYHFQKEAVVGQDWIPLLYAIAMGVSGAGSLVFGRLYDRFGLIVLVPLTLVASLFAPLMFFGGFWLALIGAGLWGLGMGVHESVIPAAVAPMVSAQRRASVYGLFTAVYGLAWFAGSAAIGALYDRSVAELVALCLVLQIAAAPLFWIASRATKEEALRDD